MRPIFVQSIPHTGSMFVFDHLLGSWLRAKNYPRLDIGEKWLSHFGEPVESPRGKFLTVVPLRNPVAVAQSWLQRGLDISQLAQLFIFVTALKAPFFLPIDSPQRNDYLAQLSQLVGAELQTDWRKIHCEPPYVSKYTDDVRDIESRCADLIGRYW